MVMSGESLTETFQMFQIMFTHYDYSISQFHHNSFKSGNAARAVPAFHTSESFVLSLPGGFRLYNLI